MALKGFLSADNYTVVVVDDYDKKEKNLTFNAITYSDSSKTSILSESSYQVHAAGCENSSVLSMNVTSVPTDASPGDSYVVGDSLESPFNGMAGTIAVRGASATDWSMESVMDGRCVYVEDEDAHYMREDGTWVLATADHMTPARWDQLFDPNIFNAVNANLMQAIYDYLKTTDEFAHTISV